MKIAVIHLGRKGAGPVYTLEMAKALYNYGHDVYYYASNMVENVDAVKSQRFKKRFFATYNSKLGYLFSVITWVRIQRVINSIKRDKPDVVYSCMNDLWAPFIFSKLKGITRVKTIHDVGVHEGNNSKFNIWWNNSNFKDAEKFVILSRKFVPKLIERGIQEDRIVVIPHAGFDYYVNFSAELVPSSKKQIILFFGRIDKYKGLHVLLQALPLVLKEFPETVLRIVGNGNLQNEMDLINKYAANIELHNRWIKDEEVSSLVQDCLFVVLPYTHATQSGVIPLAYAFGKPVLVTNVGCLDEQVDDGVTGYLVDPGNHYILAQRMKDMLKDLDTTQKMGQNAYNYMCEHLTWEASARLWTDFIINTK